MATHERGFFHKLRISIFGAVTPKRWFRDSAEMSAAVLDPQESDIREVLPEEAHESHSDRGAESAPEHIHRP